MSDVDRLIAELQELSADDLARVRAVVMLDPWRLEGRGEPEAGEIPRSEVVETRAHEDGDLTAELRRYIRQDGTSTEAGPYWYFRWKEGGKRRTMYLGKTDEPEAALKEKRNR